MQAATAILCAPERQCSSKANSLCLQPPSGGCFVSSRKPAGKSEGNSVSPTSEFSDSDLGAPGGFGAEAAGLRRRSQGRDHLSQLDVFFDKRLVTEILGIIKTGKEASAYCCRAGTDLGGGLVCAKV